MLKFIGFALVAFAGYSLYRVATSPTITAQPTSFNTLVPVGAIVTFQNGSTAEVEAPTTIATLQAADAVAWSFQGQTYGVPSS